MIFPTVLLAAGTIPGFWWISSERTATSLMIFAAWVASVSALAFTPLLAILTESLPARIRSGALGLIYAFAISIFGGSTQYVVAWLTHATGNPLAPAWYMTGAVAMGVIGILLLPETAPAKMRSDH
jgi:hypothetical protein